MGGVGTSALKTFAEVAKGLGGQAWAIVRGCDYSGSHVFNDAALEDVRDGMPRFNLKGGKRYIAIGPCDERRKDIALGVYEETATGSRAIRLKERS